LKTKYIFGIAAITLLVASGAMLYRMDQRQQAAHAEAIAGIRAQQQLLDQEMKLLEATKRAIESDLNKLRQSKSDSDDATTRGAEQTRILNEAVDNAKRFQNDQREAALRAKRFSDGIVLAQAAKVSIAEFVQSEGRWPANNQEAGLPSPDSFRNDSVSAVRVEPYAKAARIRVEFNGGGERIDLIGSANGAGQVSWQCVSPNIADIQKLFASCLHRAG
jgi:signal transduction histidine kinase